MSSMLRFFKSFLYEQMCQNQQIRKYTLFQIMKPRKLLPLPEKKKEFEKQKELEKKKELEKQKRKEQIKKAVIESIVFR